MALADRGRSDAKPPNRRAARVQQEKGAVISELSRDEDKPWDLEQKAILPLLFGPKNPYGHPVIGAEEACRGRHGRDHQGPLRQVVSPEQRHAHRLRRLRSGQAMAKIKELFGPIPKERFPRERPATPVDHKEPVHFEFPRNSKCRGW